MVNKNMGWTAQESKITMDASDLRITHEHPEIQNHPHALEAILMPLENWILSEMLINNKPASSWMIYNAATYRLWLDLQQRYVSFEVNDKNEVGAARYESPSSKDYDLMRQGLKAAGDISFPSYEKIEKTLIELESWGFLTRRYDGSAGKAKYRWVLQPAFLISYGAKCREYYLSKEVDLEW